MATTPPDDPRDGELRALVAAGELDRAVAQALRTYGPELINWLYAMMSSEADAYDAFSRVSVQLWRTLPRFDGRCSVRTWCYMLARQSIGRVRRPSRQREELVSHVPSIVGAVDEVWNTTRLQREEVENVYVAIRRALDEDDQMLLVLRVDRNLAWREIAVVMLDEDASDDDIARKSAALRKQFERIKDRLRVLAAERLGE
jgi:RNA polymerase sigma-70 factor (ECF subfamily)